MHLRSQHLWPWHQSSDGARCPRTKSRTFVGGVASEGLQPIWNSGSVDEPFIWRFNEGFVICILTLFSDMYWFKYKFIKNTSKGGDFKRLGTVTFPACRWGLGPRLPHRPWWRAANPRTHDPRCSDVPKPCGQTSSQSELPVLVDSDGDEGRAYLSRLGM